MKITRTSTISGITRSMDLPVTEEQVKRFNSGELIQNVFPDLTDDEREFIMTGITADEWDEIFPEDQQ